MLICDCGSRRVGPLRGFCRCARKPLPPTGPARWWERPLWPARAAAAAPRIAASGKTCPKCEEITYLSRRVCGGCGHVYRTIFQSGFASGAGFGVPPDRPPPEASTSRASAAFLLAAILMTALAGGLIFYFVNYY